MDCTEDTAFNSFLLFCVDLLPWKHVLVVVELCLGCLLAMDDFSALLLQYFVL
jgi:hypothetical protein